MHVELLFEDAAVVSLSDVAASSGFSLDEVNELIDLGVFEPCGRTGADFLFAARTIELARVARRLQLDFELPLSAVALALAYRERMHALEQRLHRLECLLPQHVRP